MIEKGKISAFQMGMMMHPMVLATGILQLPSITAKHAKQDLWISPIWAALVGVLTVYLAIWLHTLYPKGSIVKYSEHILGTILGKLLGLAYLLYYLHHNSIIVRQYGEFLVTSILIKTPMIVIMGSMVLICVIAVYGGVEVLGRSSQFFVPIVMILLLLIFVLLIPVLEPKKMFPIMEHGITPSLMGAVVPQSWFAAFSILSFFLPFLTDREKGMKWGMISVFAVMMTMLVANFIALFVLGGATASRYYPVLVASRYISIADFIEHLESMVIAIWVLGAFVQISVIHYALALGTAEWLNLSDYRPIILPLGFLLLLFSVWAAPNLQGLAHYMSTTRPFYVFTMQLVIPVLLLCIALVRRKTGQKKEMQRG